MKASERKRKGWRSPLRTAPRLFTPSQPHNDVEKPHRREVYTMKYTQFLIGGCGRCAAMVMIMTVWLLLAMTIALAAVVVAAVDFNAPASFLRRLLPRGLLPWGKSDSDDKRMENLRRLLESSSDATVDLDNENDDAVQHIHSDKRPAPSSWSRWHTQWFSLSESDLAAIAYDASPLKEEAHQAWGAAYIGGRRTGSNFESTIEGEAAPDDDVITAFLRGASSYYNHESERDEHGRWLESWTMHGAENDPIGGLTFTYIEQHTADAAHDVNVEYEAEADTQELLERLESVNKATQLLNEQYERYDTNDKYSYSDPNGSGNNDDGIGNESNGMQQFSHTAQVSRQRLLTGSYAAWQWYDRSNLASPVNLRLEKVSRINYAFFQTDAEGYIFGTDSWADPNVLFGPYEFATSSDKLSAWCRGGKGRDDGKSGGSLEHEAKVTTGEEGDFSTDPSDVDIDSTGGGGVSDGAADAAEAPSAAPKSPWRTRRRGQTTLATGSEGDDIRPQNEQQCAYFEQCHRNFPNSKTCNIHKYKEGLIYRAHVSGAQIYPSIGGWTLSGSFPTVAASPAKRKRFAEECVGLIADYGFDGIDIDWEYPGYEPHGGSEKDRENFNKLLTEVRDALNDYQARTGDVPLGGGAFGLTAALPCGPANIDFLDVPYIAKILSGMNLMTFDFHNEMEGVTGVNSPLYDQAWDEEEGLSVDGCVMNYYESGAGDHADKISIGVPFYGKTFSYATELNGFHSNTNGRGGGMVDQDNWPQDLGTPVYYNILDKLSKGGMVSNRHEPTMTQYAYFKDGSGLVTYDDPQAVCDKANYVNMNLLGGLFVWEMSGDLVETLETPLLDAINRKLEESNFDCRSIASPEDGTVIALPPPAPKGPNQVERREDESIVESILDHLTKAEDGELVSGGAGEGAFTREVFMYRTWDGRLFPSYVYRYEHFMDALKTMATVGVDGELFYLGYGQEVQGDEDATRRRRRKLNEQSLGQLQRQRRRRELQVAGFGTQETGLGLTEVSQRSLVYGLVNLAAFLAQAMADSIIHDACDELNIDHLPLSEVDGIGLDDGDDVHRFPVSNACGQHGRSYQDEICNAQERRYDCVGQLNIDELAAMEARGTSRGQWAGAPGPFYCGPRKMYGTTGFWDAMLGRELANAPPTPNESARTDVQECCWWGRGSLSIKGTCLYGKLNYHIGKNKADRNGRDSALFPDVDFCRDPGEICTGLDSIPLRWISGMYHWMENVQKYNREGFNYQDELVRYVNEDLSKEKFFKGATNVHLLGCHESDCSFRSVEDMDDRLRNFEKVLNLFGLQFGSHAKPEPPFRAFPGQQQPTQPPTVIVTEPEEIVTPNPTSSPVQDMETIVVPVNVFLTGVPDGVNMTNNEQLIFESLMFDLLEFRLAMVDIRVLEVVINSQIPNPEFTPDLGGGAVEDNEGKPVLQVVMDVTIGYSPPPPEGVRDWSIYIKSWIESFGNTMTEIFTSPKHIQHPQTSSKFWDDLSDVSATNVNPPNTDPTTTPTAAPTQIIYPELSDNPKNIFIIAGVCAALGLGCCLCCAFFCIKLRQYRQLQADLRNKKDKSSRFQSQEDEEQRLHYAQDKDPFQHPSSKQPLHTLSEEESYIESEDSDGSSSESSSDSSSSSSDESSSEEEEEEEASQYTEDDGTKSRSTYTSSFYSEVPESAASRSTYEDEEGESVSTYEEEGGESVSTYQDESVSTYGDTTAKSRSASTGMNSSCTTAGEESEDAAAGALRARDYNAEDSDDASKATRSQDGGAALNQERLEREERELEFDEIVERILADDPTLNQVVLDDRKTIIGNRHGSEALWNALVGNNYVERLSLKSCNITDEEVASLSLALVDNTAITHVWLGDNDITSEGVEYLIATLESNQTIVYLELTGNVDIDPALEDDVKSILEPREELYRSELRLDEVETLIERVRKNDPTLTELNLCSMGIGTREDAPSMFDALAGNCYIWKVDLSLNEIDDECLSSISLSLLDNTSITHLNLANNAINSEGAEYLIGTLNENETLEEINLEGNHCDQNVLEEINFLLSERRESPSAASAAPSQSSEIIRAAIRSLTTNDPNLIELRLNDINLARSSKAEALFESLASNTFATNLSFDNTDMDDTLVAALSLALVDNQTITDISLRDNQITNEGCEYLLGTLDSNTAIIFLDLSGNLIDDHLMNEIYAIMSHRKSQVGRSTEDDDFSLPRLLQRIKSNDPTLTELVLDNKPDDIYSHEFESILDALAQNSIVTKLSFCNNDLDDSLVAALSLALVDNTSISHVLLSDNQISNDGCEYLLGTLDSNTTVSYVDLSGNPIDGHLMDEVEVINSSRKNSTANLSPPTISTAQTIREESNIDLSKPPMYEVPEESDKELAKRQAVMTVMRDTSIPWPEKNKRIIELQQQYYVPKDQNEEPAQPQAANVPGKGNNIAGLIDRVSDNEQKLVKIELDGQDMDREDETALFDALAHNSRVTSLSLVNCRITNEGAAELIETLRQNSTLMHINLEDNQITSNAALDFIAVLKEHNKTVQHLDLKDNKVRSGLLLQLNKILEKRRPGYVEPEPIVAAMVATTSYAQVAPVTTALTMTDVENVSGNHKSRSRSKKSGKLKPRRGDRQK